MEALWAGAVCLLGGDQEVAAAAAADLGARYAESHRRYHGSVHVRAVVRDVAVLAGELRLPAEERAVLTIAAGAHDVVYDGHPGDDERRSASWARDWLARAGVGEAHVARVGELVLATTAHLASPDDLTAWVLLDADPRRGSEGIRPLLPGGTGRIRCPGRASLASGTHGGDVGLLARDPLYGTHAARRRWEALARASRTRIPHRSARRP